MSLLQANVFTLGKQNWWIVLTGFVKAAVRLQQHVALPGWVAFTAGRSCPLYMKTPRESGRLLALRRLCFQWRMESGSQSTTLCCHENIQPTIPRKHRFLRPLAACVWPLSMFTDRRERSSRDFPAECLCPVCLLPAGFREKGKKQLQAAVGFYFGP